MANASVGSEQTVDLAQFSEATPGPWVAHNHDGDRREWWTVMLGAWDVSHNEASDPGVVASAKYSAMTPKENEANARLIAAAPDLLAEVIRLRALYQKEQAWWKSYESADETRSRALIRLLRAYEAVIRATPKKRKSRAR